MGAEMGRCRVKRSDVIVCKHYTCVLLRIYFAAVAYKNKEDENASKRKKVWETRAKTTTSQTYVAGLMVWTVQLVWFAENLR